MTRELPLGSCTFSQRRVSKGGKMSSSGSWVSNVGV